MATATNFARTTRKLALAALHFSGAVAGLITYGLVGGLMGTVDPFWNGDKGLLLFMIGIPVLFFGSIVYFWLLRWTIGKLSTQRKGEKQLVAGCGFVGGVSLVYVFGVVARPLHTLVPASSLQLSLCATALIFALLTFALTRIGVVLIDASSVT